MSRNVNVVVVDVFTIVFIVDLQGMSIYSGFPTRKDEGNYNQLLSRLLQLLQTHLLEFVNSYNFSQAKMVVYSRLLIKMRQYE